MFSRTAYFEGGRNGRVYNDHLWNLLFQTELIMMHGPIEVLIIF